MTTRKQIAAAFKTAKRHLQGPIEPGEDPTKVALICNALSNNRVSYTTLRAARRIIMDRISPHWSCRDWLCENGVPEEHLTFNNVQAYRHRWLDALIEEFSQPEKKS